MSDVFLDISALDEQLLDYPELEALPALHPHFFISRLSDKPQNPIMDGLGEPRPNRLKAFPFMKLPKELAIIATDKATSAQSPEQAGSTFWSDAMMRETLRNQLHSWDGLDCIETCSEADTSLSAFLTEQNNPVTMAVRQHVMPRLVDPAVQIVHVSEAVLLGALRMTALGASSSLYLWDESTETFVLSNTIERQQGIVVVEDRDEESCNSLIRRFLTIGALLRRLELLLELLRSKQASCCSHLLLPLLVMCRFSKNGPTHYAFAYVMSTIIEFLRDSLNRRLQSGSSQPQRSRSLFSLWMQCADLEELLVALCGLCGRDLKHSPKEYPPFESDPGTLLTTIYEHLNTHIEQSSSKLVRAVFAFMLTNVSRNFTQRICDSVGYNRKALFNDGCNSHSHENLTFEDEEDEETSSNLSLEESELPGFLPPEVVGVLPAAQKSLKLFRAANKHHSIVDTMAMLEDIQWLWTEADIALALGDHDVAYRNFSSSQTTIHLQQSVSTVVKYAPELATFCAFDLEPGSHLTKRGQPNSLSPSAMALQEFIFTFPTSLPSLTPTLPILTSLAFFPLVKHARFLSNSLLSLLLTPSSTLYLPAHLELLRSYLLLTSHSFKSRLTAALFSDAEDCSEASEHKILVRKPRKESHVTKNGPRMWPLGLSPTLVERETWPPVGADLSFLLRTVIVDSLELVVLSGNDENSRYQIFREAEFRLGFAIRDMPVGGQERWLNPLSMEALDFLYMDYKPPHPIDVLISADTLLKYQRVFAFLLRLMRVDNAASAAFRMMRRDMDPPFPTLSSSNKLMLHFRFLSQSFLTAVLGYTYDTSIRGHFDAFLARLDQDADSEKPGFSDVFELAKCHSDMLDDILSACLLRSGQRAAGDLLQQALELVLEFAILVSEIKTGHLAEYQAAPLLEDLYKQFMSKVATLVQVLKGLVDRGLQSSHLPLHGELKAQPLRGVECLHDLLLRLDLGSWWHNVN